jgi:uncharacterized protein
MTLRCTGEPFALASDPPVRGVLHRVANGEDAIVLAHGAGSDHRAAALVALAQAFAARGVTALRCDLPFRQARATGPPGRAGAARDRDGLASALAALAQFAPRRRLIGGFSYGGRQASMLVAEHPSIAAALLVLSYPLHPPGKPDQARTAHLSAIRVPTLFVHGSRDPFGTGAEIEAARALISAPTEVFEWSGAGHGLPADHGRMTQVAEAFLRLV